MDIKDLFSNITPIRKYEIPLLFIFTTKKKYINITNVKHL